MTESEMIEYFIDCTMATIERMVYRKRFPVGEFRRQCRIAQKGIGFLGPGYKFKSRALLLPPGQTVENYYTKVRRDYEAAH